MRMPSERPSKSWWKTIAMTRDATAVYDENSIDKDRTRNLRYVLNSGPVVIESVMPITSECIMMPN